MKKGVFILILLGITAYVFSLPYSNPWLRQWNFIIDGVEYSFRFDDRQRVYDLGTGEEGYYNWENIGPDTLTLYNFYADGTHAVFLVEFGDTGFTCTGVDKRTGVEFFAEAAY